MEVEKKVDTPAEKSAGKSKLAILFSVFGVLIVGVVIAIVVVVTNRNNNGSSSDNNNDNGSSENIDIDTDTDEAVEETSNEEAEEIYKEIAREISTKIVEAKEAAGEGGEGLSMEQIIELYEEKIDETENVKAKAMLAMEYYMLKMSQNPGEESKDEILGGLLEIDDILKSSQSAMKVSSVAYQYGDRDMADEYYILAIKRSEAEAANRDANQPEDEETAE